MILKKPEKVKIFRKNASMSARRWCEFVVFIVGCLAFGYIFTSCSRPENKTETIPKSESSNANASEFSAIPVINPDRDFSKFQHSDPAHARFPCALCHERKDNSATPKLVGHMPCAGCHTAQFADNKSAICTICHTNAETGTVKAFPALKSFNVVFEHSQHTRQTNCATCHKPAGAAMTIPAGLNAHNSCFQCHSPEAKSGEKDIASCNTCHQPGTFAGRSSESARTFEKTPFSHASHRLDCASCHQVKSGGAARGDQVATTLVAAMHFPPKGAQSCASCHNNKRAFGGDDFKDCRRCHRGNGFKFS
jgi:hypothetical protein